MGERRVDRKQVKRLGVVGAEKQRVKWSRDR